MKCDFLMMLAAAVLALHDQDVSLLLIVRVV